MNGTNLIGRSTLYPTFEEIPLLRSLLSFTLLSVLLTIPSAQGQHASAAAPAAPAVALARTEIPTELTDYVNNADASFSWKLADKSITDIGTVYRIELISQTWHGIKWDHQLQIFVPKDVKPQATMVLYNDGGTPTIRSTFIGLELARKIKSPLAFLFGVPKQPLDDERTSDALIAESFVNYLVTEDPTWPLLFPMVKSVIRGMDAVQAFAKKEWNFEVKDFVVTGASKRGWTAWLTAGTGDKRVKAIAPLVFDTLNFPQQMDNQVKAFGKHSDMIKDYAARNLLPMPNTAAAKKLWTMIDPWCYRERITMPKMIVCGTNDEYWPLDALNTYWDGLKGDKWVLYVPNAGHHLCERDAKGKEEILPTRTIATLTAFCQCQVFNKPMPRLDCSMLCPPGVGCLDATVACDVKPTKACVYRASSETRDFRKSYWEPETLDLDGKKTACKVELPKQGNTAAVLELEFELDELKYTLSSPLRILEAPKK
jgi:PhoPQ-activated pathogenicity-related protein